MAAAASEVGALGAGGGADGNKAAAPVADARSLGAPRPRETGAEGGSSSGGLTSNAISASTGPSSGKIINVRSLPRRPGNGGGGGGGASFPGPTGVWTGFSGSRLRGAGGGGGGGGRFAAGRTGGGAGAGAGAGGAAGGQGRRRRRPTKRRGGKGADDEEGGKRGQQQQEPNTLTVREQAWLEAREVGTATAYEPSLTLESLVGYGPAVASSSASTSAVGNTSAVLRAMRVLGGGMPFCAELPNPTAAHDRLMRGGIVFFDSAAERAATEAALLSNRLVKQLTKTSKDGSQPLRAILPASAATQTAILETTVRGLYAEAGSNGQTGSSGAVFEALRRYRSKDATWSAEAGRIVENKVRSLLPATAGGTNNSGQQASRA